MPLAQVALAMVELDAEVVERVVRWCAEAGRQAGSAEIRRALAALTWDELLAVRALLADPPPARPLGPYALADLARGAPADVAAEREREGRYGPEARVVEVSGPAPAGPASGTAKGTRRRSASARRSGAVVIRRARDRVPTAVPAAFELPLLDELRRPEGRSVLERLVRRHGGRRMALLAALAAGWRTASGAPGGEDLDALLEQHGLARAFEHRERDEMLHALRAAGGVRGDAAARLGMDPAAVEAALARLGATGEVERIREARRRALRARGTLSERVRLLLADEARLRDLDLVGEFEDDLRTRLPEHVRALRAGAASVAMALSRSLSITPAQGAALVARFGLGSGRRPGAASAERSRGRDRPRPVPAEGAARAAPSKPGPTPSRRRGPAPSRTPGRASTSRGSGASPRRAGPAAAAGPRSAPSRKPRRGPPRGAPAAPPPRPPARPRRGGPR